jgi:hypothetical protein
MIENFEGSIQYACTSTGHNVTWHARKTCKNRKKRTDITGTEKVPDREGQLKSDHNIQPLHFHIA